MWLPWFVDSVLERQLRERVMQWVGERAEHHGGFLPREELLNFTIDGRRLPLIDVSRGIRNPQEFSSTLSIVSAADGPYDDIESDDGLLHYAYRTGDPYRGDNAKLRRALETGQPLILFRKEVRNILTPIFPVYVIDDLPDERMFLIALDESFRYISDLRHLSAEQRKYAIRMARQRLHQPAFRTRVLLAYRTTCAVCELKRGSLLDAAHIVPDTEPHGVPTTNNGLALCKIHHAAYDQNILAVRPDLRIDIAADVLAEIDGPMLTHGLQEMHGRQIVMPPRRSDRPSRDLLAWRYERFLAGSR